MADASCLNLSSSFIKTYILLAVSLGYVWLCQEKLSQLVIWARCRDKFRLDQLLLRLILKLKFHLKTAMTILNNINLPSFLSLFTKKIAIKWKFESFFQIRRNVTASLWTFEKNKRKPKAQRKEERKCHSNLELQQHFKES